MRRSTIVGCVLIAAALVPGVLGCSSNHRNEDYIPADDTARSALESYLAAWKAGNMDETVPGSHPVIMAGDHLHLDKRPLKDFAILGPAPGDTPRCFAVRLVLDAPYEERKERYIVVGIDPLWVMQYDDFEKLTHWCNDPLPTKTAEGDPGAANK